MNKKLVSVLLASAMAVTALAGCGSKAEGTADTAAKAQAEAGDAAESGDTVDVEFWYSGGKTAVGVVQEIVDSFNASQSKYHVSTVTQADYDETYQKLQAGIAGNAAPDLVLLNAETARTLASKNLLADMQPMIDGDSEFSADDYLKVFYDQGVDETGKVFGLPAYGTTQVMYYNMAAFDAAGVKAEDILDADLVLATREKAVRMGLNGEYFMSGRIDDLECAYTTLWGFLQGRGEEEGRGDIWVMFDNEEVGSSSRQGAQGTLMADVLARIEESMGVSREQSIRARTNALVLSADNGHATHPNHPEKSDPANPVVMGGGVLLKYNARQTYTTSGFTGAAFTAICKKAGVPVQVFANRADVPGGSTLGNLLGHQILMPMVDIGLGQLAMHSAMETASCADAEYMAKAVAEYYNTPIFQPKDGEWKLGL